MAYDIYLECNTISKYDIIAIKNAIDPDDKILYIYESRIIVKTPTKETIVKLWEHGNKYGIIPTGDDGEQYDKKGDRINDKSKI